MLLCILKKLWSDVKHAFSLRFYSDSWFLHLFRIGREKLATVPVGGGVAAAAAPVAAAGGAAAAPAAEKKGNRIELLGPYSKVAFVY